MTTVLVDADIVAYRSAAASENDPLEIALLRTDKMMRDIIEDTGASHYRAFLSGSNNFRKVINPDYKANRKDVVRPRHLAEVHKFLQAEWNAEVTDGYEADDAMGIAQSQNILAQEEWDLLYG